MLEGTDIHLRAPVCRYHAEHAERVMRSQAGAFMRAHVREHEHGFTRYTHAS